MDRSTISTLLTENKIDADLTLEILDRYNIGDFANQGSVEMDEIPGIDGKTVIDMQQAEWLMKEETARERLGELGISRSLETFATLTEGMARFDLRGLTALGYLLYPKTAYGVLNGGSATSYADEKKNSSFDEKLMQLCRKPFDEISDMVKGRAKGITPACIHPDGTAGPSYMELKMRGLLIRELIYRELSGDTSPAGSPLFQMTSVNNDEEVAAAYAGYRESPFLKELIAYLGSDITICRSGVQPMIGAFTHSEEGDPKRVFLGRDGKSPLPLPGGHGQNFAVLKETYLALHAEGREYAYLGNVDNLGNLPNPAGVALMALSGRQAAFEFSFKTPVDIKGGILIRDTAGRLNCGDIGPAISKEQLAGAESQGKPILFNCATGLFSLGHLARELPNIIRNLPTRFSDQDKDAGRYSQAEQVTWEVLGMLDDFFVFGVDKYERFIAAKLLLESFLANGLCLDHPDFPRAPDPAKDLHGVGMKLNKGLEKLFREEYGLQLEGSRWVPKKIDELLSEARTLGRSLGVLE
jgi:UTP--glucose-1-phosphate uridylyltransferase